MDADALTRAVRDHLRIGRILPLGGAVDGVWITERAAAAVLRRAAARVPDARVESLRLALADPGTAEEPAVPPPPSALPPGPLRIEAALGAAVARPLPECAFELRNVLAVAARNRLGLAVAAIDLHVTELLEGPRETPDPADDEGPDDDGADDDGADDDTAAGPGRNLGTDLSAAVLAVPGVRALPRATVAADGIPQDGTSPGRLVRLDLAVHGKRRSLDIAREAAAAARQAVGPAAVTVLVTDVRGA